MGLESLNQQTKSVLDKISQSAICPDFYLAGGTGLAIHFGHRESIDLDWFSQKKLSGEKIKKTLSSLGELSLTGEDAETVHGVLDNVKVSFFFYDYDLLFPLVEVGGVKIADERDIAAMKISAISSRGSKKDFIDLSILLKKYSLGDLLEFFEKKYQKIRYNKIHILKSLTYFDDAENEPMPMMLEKINWSEVKSFITAEVKKNMDD